jgi:hypothetical protein
LVSSRVMKAEKGHFPEMATRCPHCRTVTSEDDAPQCIACGRGFFKLQPRYIGAWKTIFFCLVLGLLLIYFVVHRRC